MEGFIKFMQFRKKEYKTIDLKFLINYKLDKYSNIVNFVSINN